jgi:thioredoxin 2
VSGSDFDRTVESAAVPVVTDFYADWCGPCRIMAPVLDQLAGEQAGRVLVLKVDTDRDPELSNRFGIRGIPTIIVFRSGREAGRHVGVATRADLDRLVGNAGAR